MTTITITTQAEFYVLPNSFSKFTYIYINSSPDIGTIVVKMCPNNSLIEAHDNSLVGAYNSSSVRVCDNSSVWAGDYTSISAYDNSWVLSCDNCRVASRGNSSVEARGDSSVWAYDNSSVEAWANSSVKAYDNSSVLAHDNSFIEYDGTLSNFASWFLKNKDNRGIIKAMKRQFAGNEDYMRKINMILLFQ